VVNSNLIVENNVISDSIYNERLWLEQDNTGIPITGPVCVLSRNGTRMVVARYQSDIVRVYEWDGTTWNQMGTGNVPNVGEDFGRAVDISSDGTTIIVAATYYSSYGTTVYDWDGSAWNQRGLTISEEFYSVSLSGDGSRFVVGNPYTNGIGSAYIYEWSNNTWNQMASISGSASGDNFGSSVSISRDGNRVAIAGRYNDDAAQDAGHVKVYEWDGSAWTQLGLNIEGRAADDGIGTFRDGVALSEDGTYLIVGMSYTTTSNNYVRVFEWTGSGWVQRGLDIPSETAGDRFGFSVDISDDGSRIITGAHKHNGTYGHTKVYEWDGSGWVQLGDTIIGTLSNSQMGADNAISGDGNVIATCGYNEKVKIFTLSESQITMDKMVARKSIAIGKTTASYELDVAGSVNANYFIGDGSQLTGTGLDTTQTLTLSNVTTGLTVSSNLEVGTANLFVDTTTGNVGIGTTTPRSALDINSTGAMIVPVGTTAQKPVGHIGMLRFNTSLYALELYNGSGWISVGNASSATGGTTTTVGNYRIHTFLNTSETFTVYTDLSVEYLVVAGGGGGGGSLGAGASGAGGGAGGMLTGTTQLSAGEYTITVGAGGAAVSSATDQRGGNGSNSSALGQTAIGGGGGGTRYNAGNAGIADGLNGGSGGGEGSQGVTTDANAIGKGTSGQGNDGGLNGFSGDLYAENASGGGGGAGSSGGSGLDDNYGGDGGDGLQSSISGTSVYYCGGGGGGRAGNLTNTQGQGGSGGGGDGGDPNGQAGTAGTGGGGGGAGGAGSSGEGGDGIVIIRYLV